MKIAITADLHNGTTPLAAIQTMAMHIKVANPDIVIIAGDIGESTQRKIVNYEIKYSFSLDHFKEVLRFFSQHFGKKGIPVLVVLGNHDIWTPPGGSYDTSQDLWKTILPEIIKRHGCYYLEDNNWYSKGSDRLAIIGSYLHYDYSAKDTHGLGVNIVKGSGFSENHYYRLFKKNVNADGDCLNGLPTDQEIAAQIGKKFAERLTEAQEDKETKDIIVVTHVPCMPCQITHNPYNKKWSLGTPYFGNLAHSEQIMNMSKVRRVVSGHSHVGNYTNVQAGNNVIQVTNLNSDYHDPKYIMFEV